MKPLLYLVLIFACFEAILATLKQEDEILYVDFRADSMPRKLKDCIEGHYTETPSGLRIPPNSALAIDLRKLATIHNFNGSAISVLIQYKSEYDMHPSLQIDMFDFSFTHNSTDGLEKTYDVVGTNMATSDKKPFTFRSSRGFIFLTFKIGENKEEQGDLLESTEIGETITTTLNKFPIIKLIAPHPFKIYQFGVSTAFYNYDMIQKICHKSCNTCVGRRMVDCTSCYNDTNLTYVGADTGKCITGRMERKAREYGGGVMDWIDENLHWIVLGLFMAVSALMIYVIWYTCCRPKYADMPSPMMKMDAPPHLELHEEK